MDSDQYLEDQAVLVQAVGDGIQRAHHDFIAALRGPPGHPQELIEDDASILAHAALNAINGAGFKIVRRD